MKKLAVLTWIGNAAAVLCGRWGAVTAQAEAAGCSRQAAYDQAQRVEQVVAEAQQPGPRRAELVAALAQLRSENQQLWQELEHAVDLPMPSCRTSPRNTANSSQRHTVALFGPCGDDAPAAPAANDVTCSALIG